MSDGVPAYRWYHSAFAGFLTSERDNPDNWFDPQRYHALVADRLHERYPEPSKIEDEYALRYLAYHDHHAGPDCFPRLYTLITPAFRNALRSRFGSDAKFRQDLAEAIAAALEEGPARAAATGPLRPDRCHDRLHRRQHPRGADCRAGASRAVGAQPQAQLFGRGSQGAGASCHRRGLLADATPEKLAGPPDRKPDPGHGADAADRAQALAQVAATLPASQDPQAAASSSKHKTLPARCPPPMWVRGRSPMLAGCAGLGSPHRLNTTSMRPLRWCARCPPRQSMSSGSRWRGEPGCADGRRVPLGYRSHAHRHHWGQGAGVGRCR